jgi:hypothetical protein
MPSAVQWPPPPLRAVTLQWLESWRLANELSRRNMEEMQRLRSRMLGDLSRCIESYMRSPEFLEFMKYTLMSYNLVALARPTRDMNRADAAQLSARMIDDG